MMRWLSRSFAALFAALVLAACQPSLESDLPVAPPSYQAASVATAVPSGPYLLRPGDRVSVTIFQEEELSQEDIFIDEGGMLTLPLIGEVQAAGHTAADLSRVIEQAYGSRYLRSPQAAVVLRALRPRTFTVEGQVNEPGVFEYEPGLTLLSAMALAGSPANDAKLDEVLVFRQIDGQRAGARFDLTEVRAGRMADPVLLPGDKVVVGYSTLRGMWRDFLTASPLLAVFGQF